MTVIVVAASVPETTACVDEPTVPDPVSWPNSRISVMGGEQAAQVNHARPEQLHLNMNSS